MNINTSVDVKKLAKTIAFILLVFGVIFLSIKLYFYRMEIVSLQEQVYKQKTGDRALKFAKLFTEKVILSKNEVDFEERLKLENAVREINDEALVVSWKKFIESKNPDEAQESVGKIYQMLINKISF